MTRYHGSQECIISGLLSVMGLKVLHIDRNNYYGGACASLNLTNLYGKVCIYFIFYYRTDRQYYIHTYVQILFEKVHPKSRPSTTFKHNQHNQQFRQGAEPPAALGSNRDYNVDLVPKFIMACGDLVKILLHTKVTR